MRIETKIITYYKYNDLTEGAKDKAVSNLYYINTDHDWHESVYEDAKTIGCEILEFDIDRGSYCKMRLDYEDTVIKAILENHGDTCETYKLAKEYQSIILDSDGNIDVDAADEFKKALQEEYLALLRREYEYLTSDTAIIETIEANEYEFDVEGNLI